MQKALKSQGVQLESWAPFAQGKNNLFNNELLKVLAGKYNKSVAQSGSAMVNSKRGSCYSEIGK